MAKRVYHPTLNSWQDVPEERVDEWAEQGWLKTKPDHVDDSESLPPAPAPSRASSAKKPAAKRTAAKKTAAATQTASSNAGGVQPAAAK